MCRWLSDFYSYICDEPDCPDAADFCPFKLKEQNKCPWYEKCEEESEGNADENRRL